MATSNSDSGLPGILLFVGSLVLIVTGGMDLATTSDANNGDYFDEPSFAAISIRSQGGLKLGLGLGMLGAYKKMEDDVENKPEQKK